MHACVLGAEGWGGESLRRDHHKTLIIKAILMISTTHLLFTAPLEIKM
jgi:hypothetical protein